MFSFAYRFTVNIGVLLSDQIKFIFTPSWGNFVSCLTCAYLLDELKSAQLDTQHGRLTAGSYDNTHEK